MSVQHQIQRGASTPSADPDTLPIGEVRRSARETIRVAIRRKRGAVAVALDAFETRGPGPARETGRGTRIPVDRLPELIAVLRDAECAARQHGLLPDGAADPRES